MNKRKKVAWHKHLAKQRKAEEKQKLARGPVSPPATSRIRAAEAERPAPPRRPRTQPRAAEPQPQAPEQRPRRTTTRPPAPRTERAPRESQPKTEKPATE